MVHGIQGGGAVVDTNVRLKWNNFTCDGFLAGGTEGASGGMIVDLTVRLPLVVKVVTPGERDPTHLKREGQERVKTQSLRFKH